MSFHAALYHQDVVRRILALREDLVRHDENLAAFHLLDKCVPYFVRHHPDIEAARRDQHAMVEHVLDDAAGQAYRDYYASNPHERPFEEQYGIEPEVAHEYLPRVQFLRDGLAMQLGSSQKPSNLKILDVSANDGWMAVNLGQLGYVVDCVDLHPGNCEIARQRRSARAGVGAVVEADLHELPVHGLLHEKYDAVVCFETLEHVAEPEYTLMVLRNLVADGGRIYISTPFGATEEGNVPNWAHVEPKGHVRAVLPEDQKEWIDPIGDIVRGEIGADRVMCVEIAPR